ncbi:MAG TPA: hypothetical protein PLU43_09060, partial [Lachnospiraceae bacterium]|nr:hypothetical protein [Lachnospiraceae bacterium]
MKLIDSIRAAWGITYPFERNSFLQDPEPEPAEESRSSVRKVSEVNSLSKGEDAERETEAKQEPKQEPETEA